MNLMEGLSAANLAMGLVKDLREIDKSVDEAAYKLKIADINSALADAKNALSDASLELNEKKEKIQSLEKALEVATKGEICPKCRSGRLQLISTKGHRLDRLGMFGVQEWEYQCDNAKCLCEHSQMHDPHGAIPKVAGFGS